MYKPYSIFTPPYEITSGGIRVMYALRSWLEIKGQIALTNTTFDVPFIGIYPEIMHGNPGKADTVVRYILNKPGVMAMHGVPGPITFAKTDKIYVFSKFYDTFGVKDDQILFCPVINLHLFRDYGQKRTKTAYFIGKGRNKGQHPTGSILIDRKFAMDQKALADLLNECHTLYGYDHLSAMYDIARLCGTSVAYYGDADEVDLQKYEPGLEGISFDGVRMRFSSDDFRIRYLSIRRDFSKKIDQFIEDTQHD